jgi:hypothetical protein
VQRTEGAMPRPLAIVCRADGRRELLHELTGIILKHGADIVSIEILCGLF